MLCDIIELLFCFQNHFDLPNPVFFDFAITMPRLMLSQIKNWNSGMKC